MRMRGSRHSRMNNWVVGSRMAEPTVAEEVCSMCDHVPLRPQSVSVSAPRERYLSRARAGTDENSARDKTNRSKRHSVLPRFEIGGALQAPLWKRRRES